MTERTTMEWLALQPMVCVCDDCERWYRNVLAAWEADRARIATLKAQRNALVPLAWWAVQDEAWDYPTDEAVSSARVALAAIAAERETSDAP